MLICCLHDKVYVPQLGWAGPVFRHDRLLILLVNYFLYENVICESIRTIVNNFKNMYMKIMNISKLSQ